MLIPNAVATVIETLTYQASPEQPKPSVTVTPVTGTGVLLSFMLEDKQVVVGEITLKKSTLASQTIRSLRGPLFGWSNEGKNTAEGALSSLIERMPASQQQDIRAFATHGLEARAFAAEPVQAELRPAISEADYRKQVSAIQPKPLAKEPEDKNLLANDEKARAAICAAYNNRLPDARLRDFCKSP